VNEEVQYALTNPQVQALFRGVVKLPREGLRTVSIRGTKGFVLIEFEATHLPRIDLSTAE
jgi:hypothetical protein